MVNDILISISDSLKEEFGEGYDIVPDDIEQGLNVPCFLITTGRVVDSVHVGKLRYFENQFMLQYFAKNRTDRIECLEVYERLCVCLEYILVDGRPAEVSDMNLENISDGVMTVTLNYNVYGQRVEAHDELMERLKITQKVGD